jgi:DNA mismatch repair protein MutS
MPPKRTRALPGKSSTLHAIYKQYFLEQSARFGPKTAILMQVGKFYELYDTYAIGTARWDTNATTIAAICAFARMPNTSNDPAVEMYAWGFPTMSLEKYENMLIGEGYTVVIVDQEMNALGEVERRAVTRVSSPGIATGTTRREEQCLLGVYVEPYVISRTRQPHWYMACTAFDVVTGALVSMETDVTLIDGRPALDTVTPFWSVYPPVEVVFFWSAPAGDPSPAPPSDAAIAAMVACGASGRLPVVHSYALDRAAEGAAVTERLRSAFLGETFHHDAAISVEEALDIERYHFIRRSLYHTLKFAKDHNPSYLRLLNDHRIWMPDDAVLLGNAALEQLGMLPLNADRAHECLLALLQRATTAMGRRALRERLLRPIADIEELDARQARIAALRADSGAREHLESVLRNAHDLARIHRRFQQDVATTDDLMALVATYEKARLLITASQDKLYGAQDSSELQTWIGGVLDAFDAARLAENKATRPSDAIAIGSHHPWRRGVIPECDAFEDAWIEKSKIVNELITRAEEILGETNSVKKDLTDEVPFHLSTTERRAKLLTNAAGARRLGMTLVAEKQGSKTTVILTGGGLDALNAEGLKIRAGWREAVDRCWRTWWRDWIERGLACGALESLIAFIGQLDADCCLARLADAYGYVRPTYEAPTEGAPAGFSVRELRHPIIERINTRTPYISHNLAVGAYAAEALPSDAATPRGLLLYGVNAAGKSSLGKAIGLAILLAQVGAPVPATEMRLIPYTKIFTRILGNDNLWAGMSSFVVEMTELRAILRNADARSLVIGDELCAGTETASAVSIVAAGVKTLAAAGTNFFFATHLHELAAIPEIADDTNVRAYHLTVRACPERAGALIYDRRLCVGTGSPMYGLEVCRGLDMDSAFLTAAFDFRRRLFDEDGAPRISRYSASVVVSACEVCGGREDLETHHIVPQAAAAPDGSLGGGRRVHDAGNLVALCGDCHRAHHKGLLEIQGWMATSNGRKLHTVAAKK